MLKIQQTSYRKSFLRCFAPLILAVLYCPLSISATYQYCVDPDWMPYEALVDGKHKGISKEYKTLFEQYSNISLKLQRTTSWKQTTEYLKAGKCDLTLMLNRSNEREQYLGFSMPFFFGPNVLVTQSDMPYIQNLSGVSNFRVGVVKGYRLVDYMDRFHPTIDKVLVDNELQGLKMLHDGQIEVYIGSLLSVNTKLKQLNYNSLKINGWTAVQDELRIGVRKPLAEQLLPIFNQAIEQIPTSVHNDIFHRWSNSQIVTQTDVSLFVKTLIATLCLLTVIGWRYHVSTKTAAALRKKNHELEKLKTKLESSNKKLEFLSYHDNLTGLYNRHYFLTTFNHLFKDVERQNSDAALMMIDIDFFKQINDRYGHNAGDAALKELGKLLSSYLRSGDIAARWGGEEFTVLMPSTSQEEVLKVAERLKHNIQTHQFPIIGSMTISVGAAQYQKNDTIHSWLERTDKALYQAKAQGRNQVKIFK